MLRNPLSTTAGEYVRQGLMWFSQSELDTAAHAFSKSLEYDTTNYLAYYHLGHIRLHYSDLSQAGNNFKMASKCAGTAEDRARALSCWAEFATYQVTTLGHIISSSRQLKPTPSKPITGLRPPFTPRLTDSYLMFGCPTCLALSKRIHTTICSQSAMRSSLGV